MNIIKYATGFIIEKCNNLRLYYRSEHYSHLIDNEGGIITGYVEFKNPENIHIGKGSYINGGQILASPNAIIVIGNNCLISYNVHFRTDSHLFRKKSLISEQGYSEKDIIIEDDVWIGYGAQIMGGTTIRVGCVIGAGSFVPSGTVTDPYSVYGGVPIKKIGKRDD